MGKVTVITSGKGGVGKTTCTANIGIALSLINKSVLVIDADIGLRNLDMVLGMEDMILHNILDVIQGRINIRQAFIHDERYPGFYLLPASQRSAFNIISPEKMNELIADVKNDFDHILIDCPAGIENGFRSATAPADNALIIVTPDISSIRDADRIIDLLRCSGNTDINLVINRINRKMTDSGDAIPAEDITDILGVRLLGTVSEDRSVIISANKGIPVVTTNSTCAHEFKNIAKAICSDEGYVADFIRKERISDKILKIFSWGLS